MQIEIKIAKFDEDNYNENTTHQNLAKATVRRYFEAFGTYMKGEEWAEWLKGVKSYKCPFIKKISHGDVMFSLVIIVSNTVLYIGRLLREWILKACIRRKFFVPMYGDRC